MEMRMDIYNVIWTWNWRTDVDPYDIVQDNITRLVIAIVNVLSSCDMPCHNYHVKNTICKITCMRTRKEISPNVEFSNLAASWESILSGFAVWFIVPEIIEIVINILQNSPFKTETTHITYIYRSVLKDEVQCGEYAFNNCSHKYYQKHSRIWSRVLFFYFFSCVCRNIRYI